MEFTTTELPGLDICTDCGQSFEHINEENTEDRCPGCQTAFRIREAAAMHVVGIQHFRMDYKTGIMVDTRRFSAFGPIED